MIVALPRFNDLVAPRFEVARYFVFARIEAQIEQHREVIQCTGCEGLGRVQLILDRRTELLICNGIRRIYCHILRSNGVQVSTDQSGPVDELLEQVRTERLPAVTQSGTPVETEPQIPLKDLIGWTQELFSACGYTVYSGAERAPFPVDLVAEITCPVCHKTVRIAICCGAHTYRCDQEIAQLHRVAGNDFHACVYIHPATEHVQRFCSDYGIELLDPNASWIHSTRLTRNRIPILQNPIPGHERAFAGGRQERAP
jgi:predicted Fe-Mo cluster-binding NifX family protein